MAEKLRLRPQTPSRIERKVYQDPEDLYLTTQNTHNRPSFINFMCMILVAIVFDSLGLFLSEIPGVGTVIVFISDIIFIPWFYMSGMKFTNKRAVAMGAQTIAESIPFIGNLPLITVNVIYSYYSN
jgi:hypothetical protein